MDERPRSGYDARVFERRHEKRKSPALAGRHARRPRPATVVLPILFLLCACSSARPPAPAPSPSLQVALAPMAEALAKHAGSARILPLVRAGDDAALPALADALERELVARGVAVRPGVPDGSSVRLTLREPEGRDAALVAEVYDAFGERVDLIAAPLPRAIVAALAPRGEEEVTDGFLVRRDLGAVALPAADVLLFARPSRALLASPDSAALVPLSASLAAEAGISTGPRTLPPSRDPAAMLFAEDLDGDGTAEIVLLTNGCEQATVFEEATARALTKRSIREAPRAGLRGTLLPVAGRGYFDASPADSLGAAPPLRIYDLTRGDFDGDGVDETAVARVGEQAWVVSDRFPFGAGVDRCGAALAAADLDGKGADELVVTAAVRPDEGDFLTVYRWDGVEFIEWGRTEAVAGSLIALDAADLDGDRRDEIVALERRIGEKGVRLLLYRLPRGSP